MLGDLERDRISELLKQRLTDAQIEAVTCPRRRVLVVAGAGSGKTEVMARRIAWKVAIENAEKSSIVAFTFTERAAQEMKFRVRLQFERITPQQDDATLGDMYVGTIHGYCLKMLRELDPDSYHNYDVIDDSARLALVERGYNGILALRTLQDELGAGKFETINTFLRGYDLLHEYGLFAAELAGPVPAGLRDEANWCKGASLVTDVGSEPVARSFALSAARFYAYLRCRRFLDFSTSQSELVRVLDADPALLERVRVQTRHLVVDEVQDVNPIQARLVKALLGSEGTLTAVGDHRQSIFAWRGGRVDIMAALHDELVAAPDGEVIQLQENFRSTPRIIAIANEWATTIGQVRGLTTPAMIHGRKQRVDYTPTHVALHAFPGRFVENEWIATTVASLVARSSGLGARHDGLDVDRGIAFADVAILLRSSTDARSYMQALERKGIPAVFRAGPDLFSQPEVLLFLAAMSVMAGVPDFYGGPDPRSLPSRIRSVLGCGPDAADVIVASCDLLRQAGLPLATDVADRVVLAARLIQGRMGGQAPAAADVRRLRHGKLRAHVSGTRSVRRVFPQALFQLVLAEAEVDAWGRVAPRGTDAMFHLGALSTLIKGIETPGWTDPADFKYQMIALANWGTRNARTEEAPLLVDPDAVTISTIHAAKGLEFTAVFLADVCALRFPSSRARTAPTLPLDGPILSQIDPADLCDNPNNDHERRLLYVALTRAERYLFVTASGKNTSAFMRQLRPMVQRAGGTVDIAATVPGPLDHLPIHYRRDIRLVSSFSDLRYYIECPHDFYLRKVLGFAPTIDQAFGYGRGVHNLLRAVHSNPAAWAALATDAAGLRAGLERLVERGLFYLRYTVGEPEANMREKALRIVQEYVETYAPELRELQFEPEREFETLIEEEQVLISGAIDLIRLDDPPRVTLVDFKSGESDSDIASKLDRDEMQLQVSLYGLAAKRELEYQPDTGLVRYLGETDPVKRELSVNLDDASLAAARETVVAIARSIRGRLFDIGPQRKPRNPRLPIRCAECDFIDFCGRPEAVRFRSGQSLASPDGTQDAE